MSKKYIRDYDYKGELKRLRSGRYEYTLNDKKYHIHSEPWFLYGRWIAKSGDGYFNSSNTLSNLVWNIDRNTK
jgi:hypothetical protein